MRRVLEGCYVLLLAAVPVAGYAALYGSGSFATYLVLALVEGLVGGGVALLIDPLLETYATRFGRSRSGRRAWLRVPVAVLVVAGVALVAWFVVAPSGHPNAEIASGLRAILTLNQPVDVAAPVLALPFLLTSIGTGLGLLALRSRWPLLPVLPPAVTFASQLLLCAGIGRPGRSGVEVAAFAGLALLLAGLRRRQLNPGDGGSSRNTLLLPVFAVVVAASVAGSFAALPARARFDPRQRWQLADLEQQVTPLSLIRSELADPTDTPRFSITIDGASSLRRVAVARLDVFDGTSWTARPQFRVAGAQLRADDGTGSAGRLLAQVTVMSLPGNLLPTVGDPVRLETNGTPAPSSPVRFDRDSGMLSVSSAPNGWAYTVQGRADERAEDGDPPTVTTCRTSAAAYAGDALRRTWLPQETPGASVLQQLATRMQRTLPYDPKAPAGSSLAAIERVLSGTGPAQAGNAEQHAAAFSFLACAAGRPARVVVGYRLPAASIPGQAQLVRAHDVYAWSEVYFGRRGWLAFDPTDPNKPVTALNAGAAPVPTPSATPVAPPPAVVVSGVPTPRETSRLTRVVRVIAGDAGLVALAVLVLALLGLLGRRIRARRRRRLAEICRRHALLAGRDSPDARERVLAAWRVATEWIADQGVPVRASSTPDEVADLAAEALGERRDTLRRLVPLVNAALFGPRPPSPADAELAWHLADDLRTASSAASRVPVPVGGRP